MTGHPHGYIRSKEIASQNTRPYNPGPFIENNRWMTEPAYYGLPHQCDTWLIGDANDVKELIADLEKLIETPLPEPEDEGD